MSWNVQDSNDNNTWKGSLMADSMGEKTISRAHFIGIGGAGMSGIALVLHERGCTVTGSDLKSSHYVRELEDAGIQVSIGHTAATIDAVMPDVIVTSTAIPETNPEVIRARELSIPIWPRAKMLSYQIQRSFAHVSFPFLFGLALRCSRICRVAARPLLLRALTARPPRLLWLLPCWTNLVLIHHF